MSDVAEIAKGLTKAQRLATRDTVGAPGMYLTRWMHGRSADALASRGLAFPRAAPGCPVILTDLGEQVRNHLLETQNA